MPISVPFSEVGVHRGPSGESPNERWLPSGDFQAYIQYKCAWGNRVTLLSEVIQDPYPHQPSYEAYAYAANVVGIGQAANAALAGQPAGYIEYEEALLTVYFGTVGPWRTAGFKFVTEEIHGAYSSHPVSKTDQFRWGAADGPSYEISSKEVAELVYILTFYNVYNVPVQALTLMDTVNHIPMASYTFPVVFPAETLWYYAPAMRRTLALGRLPGAALQYTFRGRAISWNHRWHAGSGWGAIYTFGGSQVIFHALANHQLLVP